MLTNSISRPKILLACISVIAVSVFISLFTGNDFGRNFIYLYAYLLIVGQYFLRKHIPWWVLGVFLTLVCADAVIVGLYRAGIECAPRPFGFIADNPNPSAAVVLLSAVWLIANKQYWAIPLLAFLPFTGSRATILMAIPIMALFIFIRPGFMLKTLAGALAVGIVIYGSIQVSCPTSDNAVTESLSRTISALNPAMASEHVIEAQERTRGPLSLTPQGELYSGEDLPMHNVPIRYAYTYGVLSALAWAVTMFVCLTWNIGSRSWWLVLAIFGLSWLDYYFIEPYFLLPFTWFIFFKHLDTKGDTNEILKQTN